MVLVLINIDDTWGISICAEKIKSFLLLTFKKSAKSLSNIWLNSFRGVWLSVLVWPSLGDHECVLQSQPTLGMFFCLHRIFFCRNLLICGKNASSWWTWYFVQAKVRLLLIHFLNYRYWGITVLNNDHIFSKDNNNILAICWVHHFSIYGSWSIQFYTIGSKARVATPHWLPSFRVIWMYPLTPHLVLHEFFTNQ